MSFELGPDCVTSPSLCAVLAMAPLILILPAAALSGTIAVNSTADVVSDDGQCTLREAITAANTDSPSGVSGGECVAGQGEDTIFLPGGTFTLAIASTDENNNVNGDLDISSVVSIIGAGPASTVVQAGTEPGNGISGVFHVTSGVGNELTVEGMTIRHASETMFHGGAIYNERTTNIRNCVITLNTADHGGGVRNSNGLCTLNVHGTAFLENTAMSNGGAIENQQGTVNIANSTISGNWAGHEGGALHTVNSGKLHITVCTIANNSAATQGGGISNPNASAFLHGVIMTGNSPSECSGDGTFGDLDNLIDDSTCGGAGNLGAVSGFDPEVGDNGGPTPTHALLPGSNAIDQLTTDCLYRSSSGNPLFANADPIDIDQRGAARPQGGQCDVGAYEYPADVFADDFESGDTSAWSGAAP